MQYAHFGSKYIVRNDKGEELVATIKSFCLEHSIKLATVTGIGAVNKASIGIFIQDTQKYKSTTLTGSLEIASLSGTVTQLHGEAYIHLHIIITDETYNAYGGHLNAAWIGATAEEIIDVIEGQVERAFNDGIGLNLLKFS